MVLGELLGTTDGGLEGGGVVGTHEEGDALVGAGCVGGDVDVAHFVGGVVEMRWGWFG